MRWGWGVGVVGLSVVVGVLQSGIPWAALCSHLSRAWPALLHRELVGCELRLGHSRGWIISRHDGPANADPAGTVRVNVLPQRRGEFDEEKASCDYLLRLVSVGITTLL